MSPTSACFYPTDLALIETVTLRNRSLTACSIDYLQRLPVGKFGSTGCLPLTRIESPTLGLICVVISPSAGDEVFQIYTHPVIAAMTDNISIW